MPTLCCVTGCKSNISSTPEYIKKFSFPKDEKTQIKWLRAMRRPDLKITRSTNVCIRHFADKVIKKGQFVQINGVKKFFPLEKWSLVDGAIPTIFPHGATYLRKKKQLREKPLRREGVVKIVNEPVLDDNDKNNSETESAQFDNDVNNKSATQTPSNEDMDIEDEAIQSQKTKLRKSKENYVGKEKRKIKRKLRVKLKKYKGENNGIYIPKYNTDDGLLIENHIPKTVRVKYDGKNYKTTVCDSLNESQVNRSLDRSAVAQLKSWLYEHRFHPYPTENEKEELARTTGLKIHQVINWFINARRRFLPAVLKEEGLFLKGSRTLKSVHKLSTNGPKLSETEIKKLNEKLNEKKYAKEVKEIIASRKREIKKEKDLIKPNPEKNTTFPKKSNTTVPVKEIKNVKEDNKTKREIIFSSSEDGVRHVIGHKIIHVASGKVIKLEIYNKKSPSEKNEKKDTHTQNVSIQKETFDKKKVPFKEKKLENKPKFDIEEKDPLLINPEDFKKYSKTVAAPLISSEKAAIPSMKTETLTPISLKKPTTLSLATKKDVELDKIKHYLIIRNNKSKNVSSIPSTNKKITIALKSPPTPTETTNNINKNISIKNKTILALKKDSVIEKNDNLLKKMSLTNHESTLLKDKPPNVENKVENIKPLNMNFENINTPSNSISSVDYPVRFQRSRETIIKGICKKERSSKCLYMLVETDNDEDVRTYDSDSIIEDDIETHDSDFINDEDMEEEILENEFEY